MNRIQWTTLLWALIAASSVVRAEEPSKHILILHGISKHQTIPTQRRWQEVNPGIGYRYQLNAQLSGQIGTCLNSYNKWSVYSVFQYTPFNSGNAYLGGFIGAATRYPKPVIGGFLLDIRHDNGMMTIRHVPKIKAGESSATTLEVGWRF